MKEKKKKILKICIIIYLLVLLKLCLKIIVNKQFIKNYPDKQQEYRLVLLSAFNIYQPYIAPYNYGNYLYKQGRYEEAYEKYKKSLTYKIPKIDLCSVTINIGLSLNKMAEEKAGTRKKELLQEAQWYLEKCLSIDPDDEDLDGYYDEEIGEYPGEEEQNDNNNNQNNNQNNNSNNQNNNNNNQNNNNNNNNNQNNNGQNDGQNDIASQQQDASDLNNQIGNQISQISNQGTGNSSDSSNQGDGNSGQGDGNSSDSSNQNGPSDSQVNQIENVMNQTQNGGDPTGTGQNVPPSGTNHENGNGDGGPSSPGSQGQLGCHKCG